MSKRLCESYFSRIWMPYCFMKMDLPERGKHIYLPLNRDYKPLGVSSDRWVNYADFANQCVQFSKDPAKIAGNPWALIKPHGWRDPGPFLFLYDDRSETSADYGRRLQLVLQQAK